MFYLPYFVKQISKFKLLKKLNTVQFDCSATRLFVSYNFSFSVVELNYMEINYMYIIV